MDSSTATTTTEQLKFTLQFGYTFYGRLTGRFGIKESTGGLGIDLHLLRDHLLLSVDAFDTKVQQVRTRPDPRLVGAFQKIFYVSLGLERHLEPARHHRSRRSRLVLGVAAGLHDEESEVAAPGRRRRRERSERNDGHHRSAIGAVGAGGPPVGVRRRRRVVAGGCRRRVRVGHGQGDVLGVLDVSQCTFDSSGNRGPSTPTARFPIRTTSTRPSSWPIREIRARPVPGNELFIRVQNSTNRVETANALIFEIFDSYEVARCMRGRTNPTAPTTGIRRCAIARSSARRTRAGCCRDGRARPSVASSS